MSEVAPYRKDTRLRVLLAFGLTQDFFAEERTRIPAIMKTLKDGFANLEERFGVRVLGTLDDDETMVGATPTWPWTCYVLAEAPDREAVAAVCGLVRELSADGVPLWKYLKVEARLGRPLVLRRARMTEEPFRIAVVTGAGRGLGEAIAERFVRDGYRVVYADRDQGAGAAGAVAIDPTRERTLDIGTDVRDLTSVQACLDAAVERWGRVDVWVNNAARTEAAPFLEIDPDEWDDVLATNLRGTYFGCRVAGRHMQERGSGRILNLASLAGQWGRSITGAHYAASKAGIVALTRFAAIALAPHGVTVNAIAPGPIDGPSVAAMPPEKVAAYMQQIPVQRLGRPDEVAALAAFLVSEESGFVTGATYDVNGGMLMR